MMKRNVLVILMFWAFSVQAGEKDLYDFLWLDPDKSVYVLQNKIYPKDKTLYVDLGYINGLSSKFQDTSGTQVRVGYFLKEDFAFEFSYGTYLHQNNSTLESVKAVNGVEPFTRRTKQLMSINAIWSPFYGKINTFNKIYYFDWYFGFGLGKMDSESNLKSVTQQDVQTTFQGETYNPLVLKSGLKIHANRRLHIGIEFQSTNFKASSPKNPNSKDWVQSNDLIFSLGVSF